MMKAEKAMQEALKLVDLVVELIDARAPMSSRNPDLREILQNRPFLTVANKSDLADAKASKAWVEWYAKRGERLFMLDSRKTGTGCSCWIRARRELSAACLSCGGRSSWRSVRNAVRHGRWRGLSAS